MTGLLVLLYFIVILPAWIVAEVWASRTGRARTQKTIALWITRAFALAGVAWALYVITVGASSFWSDVWDQWADHYPELLRGYRTTIILTLVSFALAMALGAVVALMRTSELLALRLFAGAYTEWFRNTPLLVQLFFWFFGLPRLELPIFGRPDWFLLSSWQAAILGLTLYTGAYTAEALRSGLLSIDKGQTEAARSIGLNYLQTRVHVVVPQALRVALPLLTSIFSALFRNSALVSAIGLSDLLRASLNVGEDTFKTYEVLTLAGILYLSLTLPLAFVSNRLERRIARSR